MRVGPRRTLESCDSANGEVRSMSRSIFTRVLMSLTIPVAFLCVAATRPSHSSGGHTTSALLDFGSRHKSCRVWTDWNRVCARKPGSSGTECLNSPTDSVSPSTPFCAAGRDADFDRMTPAELESSNRFCATFMDHVLHRGTETLGPYHVCVSHVQNRPFSKVTLPSYFCREVAPVPARPPFRPGEIDVRDRRIPVTPPIDLRPCR